MIGSNENLPINTNKAYKKWLASLKQQFRQAQVKASVQVNQG